MARIDKKALAAAKSYTASLDSAQASQLAAITPHVVPPNTDASPALGTLEHNHEYRCTNSVTTAPTMTLAAIASTASEFVAVVVYTAPNATAPVVTNSSGKTLKYKGDGVTAGTFTPTPDTTYHLSFLWDGVYLTCYVSGVA